MPGGQSLYVFHRCVCVMKWREGMELEMAVNCLVWLLETESESLAEQKVLPMDKPCKDPCQCF